DIGLTSEYHPGVNGFEELSREALNRLTVYQQLPGVPVARDQGHPLVMQGKELFKQLNCSGCHRMSISTDATAAYPELSNQVIHPFTDLLLHDMGPGLADRRAEFNASGRHWRTTPLWGLGFSRTLSSVRQQYLHDGRARTIEEAILWHGGEAKAARENFKRLPRDARKALIRFLNSL
ncbi:MAG: thiol oxidoreductase, partial [Proteobacteria bacterium]|nr:thiol oxidoreductase [Pseudomonadota bacterium]